MAQNLAITDPFFCDLPIEAVNEGDDHDSRFFFSDSSRRSFLGSPQIDLAAAPLAFRRHPRDLDLLSIEFSDHRPYLEAFRHLTRACFHHHRQRLAEAGILRPIWAAAHLFTDISPRALKELILRWSPPSKAFWRSGGWTTPTGEDVDSLSELSFEDDKNLVNMSFGPNEVLLYDQLQKMTTALTKLGRELYISNWMSFLQRSVKADSVPFLTGVLCVWLQLFICPSKSNILHPRVYRLACCLSAGNKIPLGSLFLGNTYLELDGIIKSFLDGALHVSTSLNAQFLMLFIFERFPTVAPTRNASTHSLVDYFDPEFFYSSFPRAILWHNVKVDPNMSIELALNHTALYCERPYLSRYSNIASVTYPGIVRDVGCFMSKNIISHAHFETWIATLLPHAVWALKEDDREVYRWVEVAYMPHFVMGQFGLDQTWPHYFDMGFLSKSRSKPMISHYFPYLQNLSAVPLPAYGRVGRASLTFISRWTHFLGIVRATRDIVPVAPGVEVQLSPQRRPRQGDHLVRREFLLYEASSSSPRSLPKLLEDHSAKLARIEASLRETLQGDEPSLAIGGSIEQGVIATVPSPSQAQAIIPAAVQIGASHTQEGGPPQNLNATDVYETPAGTLPHVGLISSAAKDIVNITDPANNEIIMTSTCTNIDVPSDISTRLQVSSPRHLALTPLIQLPRDLNPTLQYWCHFYHTKDPGFLPMLDRLHDWFRYTVAATVGQILVLFNATPEDHYVPISHLRQEVLRLWAVVDRPDVKLPVLREMIESCRESSELIEKGEEVARAEEDFRAMMTRVDNLRTSYEVMQEKCWPFTTAHSS